jgi:hypothetical protein
MPSEVKMSIAQIIDKVQYLTDEEGNRQAVQINIASWEQILELLKDIEDELEWNRKFAEHPEVLERLADEAEIEVEAGRTKELIPEEL